ncbi:MAG: hypothetical protein AB8F74_20975 [Saprospiraceae bacterium]
MNLLEVKLENPIGFDEVIRLKSALIQAEKHDFLIIDIGNYDFESGKVLSLFTSQLYDLEPCLTKFKKVALVVAYSNDAESKRHIVHNICNSREEAIKWLQLKKLD